MPASAAGGARREHRLEVEALRTGVGQRHSIRLEGGDDSFRYSVSLQYNDIQGVMKGSDRESFNGGVTLSYSHRNFLFSNDLIIGHTQSDASPYGSVSASTRLKPYWPPTTTTATSSRCSTPTSTSSEGAASCGQPAPTTHKLNQTNSNKYTDITNNLLDRVAPLRRHDHPRKGGPDLADSDTDDYKTRQAHHV